jgi:dolichol-phosphate mannosyltransferase
MTLGACITARNEAESIGALVKRLRADGFRVFVTDDGSSDGTGLLAEDSGATVQRHDISQGIAAGLMAAWRMALAAGCTRVVQLDAGGSHRSQDADGLLAALAPGWSVVVGSRFACGGRYTGGSWRRMQGSRVAARMCNLVTGARLTDWTSGYRAFTATALGRLLQEPYTCRMHGWQIETLAAALRWGMTVAERPITYAAGASSFNRRVAWEALRAWRRLWI